MYFLLYIKLNEEVDSNQTLDTINSLFNIQGYIENYTFSITEDNNISGEVNILENYTNLTNWSVVITSLINSIEEVLDVNIENQLKDTEEKQNNKNNIKNNKTKKQNNKKAPQIKIESNKNEKTEIWAISDLHLGPGQGKQHYSSSWVDHQSKIRKAWDKLIKENSIVLMPGDFSWNDELDDLYYDYLWIDDRPGKVKVMSQGNHDSELWENLQDIKKLTDEFDTLTPLSNNIIKINNPYTKSNLIIAAVEGSQSPNDKYFDTNAGVSSIGKEKESVRFLEQVENLKDTIKQAKKVKAKKDDLVIMIHYPPFANENQPSIYTKLIENSGAKLCLYGHLHQKNQFAKAFQGERNGVEYRFVGADFNKFSPVKIGQLSNKGLEIDKPPVDGKKEWGSYNNSYTTSYTTSYNNRPTIKRRADTGKELRCIECNKYIYTDETSHYSPDGPIHGNGKYGERGTCKFKPSNLPSRNTNTSNNQDSKKTPNFYNKKDLDNFMKGSSYIQTIKKQAIDKAVHVCFECNQEIKVGEVYHRVASNKVAHGKGYLGQIETCYNIEREDNNKDNDTKQNIHPNLLIYVNDKELPKSYVDHSFIVNQDDITNFKKCVECESELKIGELVHWKDVKELSIIHGLGYTGDEKTCPYEKEKKDIIIHPTLLEYKSNQEVPKQYKEVSFIIEDLEDIEGYGECVECNQQVQLGEIVHWASIDSGYSVIHGLGMSGQKNTCPYKKEQDSSNQETESLEQDDILEFVESQQITESLYQYKNEEDIPNKFKEESFLVTEEDLEWINKHDGCFECNQPLEINQVFHWINKQGYNLPVHGVGFFDQPDTCPKKKNNSDNNNAILNK